MDLLATARRQRQRGGQQGGPASCGGAHAGAEAPLRLPLALPADPTPAPCPGPACHPTANPNDSFARSTVCYPYAQPDCTQTRRPQVALRPSASRLVRGLEFATRKSPSRAASHALACQPTTACLKPNHHTSLPANPLFPCSLPHVAVALWSSPAPARPACHLRTPIAPPQCLKIPWHCL